MISFLNDYNEIGDTEILEELIKLKDEKYSGYSVDEKCEEAKNLIKKELQDENVEIHFLHGGTITNVIGLIMSLKRHESIISCSTGHIVNTENGSIESVGHQVVIVPEHNGKVVVEEVKKALKSHKNEYNSKPKVVYISNVTELGTVYTKEEIKKLYKYCKENDLYLFMDGARLGAAVESKYSDLEFKDLTKYLDAFYIGGTKNGFLFGEALVFVNEELKNNYQRMVIKQKGALLAKGFLLGIQYEVMFRDGKFFKNAKNAVDTAQKLSEVFEKHGFELTNRVEANLIFVNISYEVHEKLSSKFIYEAIEEDTHVHCRFVTTWNTRMEEINQLDKFLSEI